MYETRKHRQKGGYFGNTVELWALQAVEACHPLLTRTVRAANKESPPTSTSIQWKRNLHLLALFYSFKLQQPRWSFYF